MYSCSHAERCADEGLEHGDPQNSGLARKRMNRSNMISVAEPGHMPPDEVCPPNRAGKDENRCRRVFRPEVDLVGEFLELRYEGSPHGLAAEIHLAGEKEAGVVLATRPPDREHIGNGG